MTNVDLSYAREVLTYRFEGEEDWTKRETRLSVYSRPVCRAKSGMEGLPQLPDVPICMHWGVRVEFHSTSKGLGRCIYTFDADTQKKDDLCSNKTDFPTLLKALVVGDFVVTGFEYYPDQETSKFATKHPYEDEIIERKDHITGLLAPAELLRVVRQCALKYADKTYNFLFNNCQDFANHLSAQIGLTMKSPDGFNSRSTEVKSYWTAGEVAIAGTATVAAIGCAIWGAVKLFGSSSKEEEKEGTEEESRKHRVK